MTSLTAAETANGSMIIYDNHAVFVDYKPTEPIAPMYIGEAKVMYRAPVQWDEDETATFYAENPASSPTGAVISVTMSTEAIMNRVTGPQFDGFVFGIGYSFRWQSGPIDDQYVVYIPYRVYLDGEEAKIEFRRYLDPIKASRDDAMCENPSQACVDTCYGNYLRDINTADAAYKLRREQCFNFIRVTGATAVGCTATMTVCLIFPTPPSMIACCAIGGTAGVGLYLYKCLDDAAVDRAIAILEADRDFRTCRRGCCPNGQ